MPGAKESRVAHRKKYSLLIFILILIFLVFTVTLVLFRIFLNNLVDVEQNRLNLEVKQISLSLENKLLSLNNLEDNWSDSIQHDFIIGLIEISSLGRIDTLFKGENLEILNIDFNMFARSGEEIVPQLLKNGDLNYLIYPKRINDNFYLYIISVDSILNSELNNLSQLNKRELYIISHYSEIVYTNAQDLINVNFSNSIFPFKDLYGSVMYKQNGFYLDKENNVLLSWNHIEKSKFPVIVLMKSTNDSILIYFYNLQNSLIFIFFIITIVIILIFHFYDRLKIISHNAKELENAVVDTDNNNIDDEIIPNGKESTHDLENEIKKILDLNENLLRIMAEGVIIEDKNGNITYTNDSFSRMTGYLSDDVKGRHWAYIVSEESVLIVKNAIKRRNENTPNEKYEIEIRGKNGLNIDVVVAASELYHDNIFIGRIIILTDISEQKRSKIEILKLNKFLRYVIDNASVWINVLDASNKVVLWNQAAEYISGYSKSEVLGRQGITHYIYPEKAYRSFVTRQVEKIITDKGIVEDLETVIVTKKGTKKTISWYSKKLVDANGNYNGSLSMGIDVTDKNEAFKRNQYYSQMQTNLLQILKQISSSLDLDIVLNSIAGNARIFVNAKSCGIFMLDSTGEILISKANSGDVIKFIDSDSGTPLNQEIKKSVVLEMKSILVNNIEDYPELEDIRKDSTSIIISPIRDEEKLFGLIYLLRDNKKFIEEDVVLIETFAAYAFIALKNARNYEMMEKEIKNREEREKLAAQSHKMEVLGSMAAGIAHDINNALTGITGTTSLLKKMLEGENQSVLKGLKSRIETLSNSADKIKDTVLNIQNFYRKDLIDNNKIVNLKKIIKIVHDLCKMTLDKAVKIDVSYCSEECFSNVSKSELEQSLHNLCINASHSMTLMRDDGRWGGLIRIIIRKVYEPTEYKEFLQSDTIYNVIEVEDSGVGISHENLINIFTPFFTTKSLKKGTGMGLFNVKKFVEKSNGYIFVKSEIGKGSKFSMYLPDSGKEEDKSSSSEYSLDFQKFEGVALVCDDEEVVRTMLKDILTNFGIRVITAENGEEAINKFTQWKPALDYVFFDLSMPEMDGSKLFSEFIKMDQEKMYFLITGYQEDERIDLMKQMGLNFIIKKPFDTTSVYESIKSATVNCNS
ncbi:MAG: PAS domain S-box protein [Candidatus Delongbacteria bacterium]|nr:PAS domain S-box protein [Candidatus Delongbacteria bacterium]MBN2836117.1 PAS domain S-box protein [Candidatus Delongbacteria bacterium]